MEDYTGIEDVLMVFFIMVGMVGILNIDINNLIILVIAAFVSSVMWVITKEVLVMNGVEL